MSVFPIPGEGLPTSDWARLPHIPPPRVRVPAAKHAETCLPRSVSGFASLGRTILPLLFVLVFFEDGRQRVVACT
ncbi:hypothetical protein PENSPDRAFT_109759 [Peniophora sp. CONT]|nr:hypothetical protein PENSPDRAFT_109759 [Peniophora sp. CONT]